VINSLRPRPIVVFTFTIVVLLNFGRCSAAEIDFLTAASLAPEIRAVFEKQLLKRYQISTHINPFYLHGDFDGDGQTDTALLIKDRSSGKIGIAILHGKAHRIAVVGAGRPLDTAGDDFSWMDAWYVFQRGPVRRGADEKAPPKLRGDALMVSKSESASALVYWNGKSYAWYQQGD
jgi:hypothetical protein